MTYDLDLGWSVNLVFESGLTMRLEVVKAQEHERVRIDFALDDSGMVNGFRLNRIELPAVVSRGPQSH